MIGVAVVEEVGTFFSQGLDSLIVSVQSFIHLFTEFFSVVVKQFSSFLKGHAYRAVSAVIYIVTAGLV